MYNQQYDSHTHVLYHLLRRLAGMNVPPRPGSALVAEAIIRLCCCCCCTATHRWTIPDRITAVRNIIFVAAKMGHRITSINQYLVYYYYYNRDTLQSAATVWK